MKFSVITIFPDMIRTFAQSGLLAKGIEKKLLQIDIYDLRDFTTDKHRKVDDRPFGGGAGMVMKPEPLFNAVEHIQKKNPGRVILFSAYAPVLNQSRVKSLAVEDHLILVCGRYEGVDQRFVNEKVDEEISIGSFVLMGGELAAGVLIESAARMVPGVIGNPESVMTDSFFFENQWGFPQYTQPRCFRGLDVPEVLLSGNHSHIEAWRNTHRFSPQKKETSEKD